MPLKVEVFRHYELIVLIHPETPDSAQDAAKERVEKIITDRGGKIVRWETWGKRRLAYEIDKQNKAFYHYVNFVAPQTTVAEVERNLRIMESVVLYQTVRLADQIDLETFDFEEEGKKRTPLYMSPEDAAAAERNYQREREWAQGGRSDDARGRDDDDSDDGDDSDEGDDE